MPRRRIAAMRMQGTPAAVLLLPVAMSGCVGTSDDAGPGRLVIRLDGQATRGTLQFAIRAMQGDAELWADEGDVPATTDAVLLDRDVAGGKITIYYDLEYAYASSGPGSQTSATSFHDGSMGVHPGVCTGALEVVFHVTNAQTTSDSACADA